MYRLTLKSIWASGVIVLGVAVVAFAIDSLRFVACAAEAVPAEEIIQRLKPRKTRSLEKKAPVNAERIEQLKRAGKTRGLNHQERDELAAITRENPQIDLTIYFALDSAEISEKARPQLDELGKSLAGGLRGQSFTLAGHSDARGTPEYNLSLSKRRAEAVQRYLVERFKVDPDALLAVGFGFEHLKRPDDPMADDNRRVQIVNIAQ
jgi:outer membrane protein OmpA-like peptidoglycan-associated protein